MLNAIAIIYSFCAVLTFYKLQDVIHIMRDLEAGFTQFISIFLKSSIGVSVNVMSFGSTYERLFVESQPVTDGRAIATAQRYAQRMTPNLGGTELWQPLHSLFLLGNPERQ